MKDLVYSTKGNLGLSRYNPKVYIFEHFCIKISQGITFFKNLQNLISGVLVLMLNNFYYVPYKLNFIKIGNIIKNNLPTRLLKQFIAIIKTKYFYSNIKNNSYT